MPSDARSALDDILEHIHLSRLWTAGFTLDSFQEDRLVFYAVTRCLSIISEATRRLSTELLERHPGIPWRAIKDAGNVYRHMYDDVLENDVWDVVQNHLAPLERVVLEELARLT